MFVVEALFIRLPDRVDACIEAFQTVLEGLERSHALTVLHDPKFSWLMVKGRLELSGDQRKIFEDAMVAAGMDELIQITWDDQWSWTTYRHFSPAKPIRWFVLHPEPEDGQSPWITNVGDKEPWETYREIPGDDDLQAMAVHYQLPGITHAGRLDFPEQWAVQRELKVAGKTSALPPPLPDPNGLTALFLRTLDGEVLSIADALRLLNAGLAAAGSTFLSQSMRAHPVYAPKRRWFRGRPHVRGPKGQKLIPALSFLEQIPGIPVDQLKREFSPVRVMDLINELKPDEGLSFDLFQKGSSLQVDPEDVPSFRKMIASPLEWLGELP